ncbi:MAG: hypothetical protein ABJN95_07945 [Maribacter sp.]|uniref:hypothetical protein n=1 Tax=Maribacter sp. TaxID=1897614 RepID=UPI003297A66C
MKTLLRTVVFLIPLLGWSQTDIPTTKPLKIEAANKLDKEGKKDKGTALRIPDVIKEQPKINFKDSLGRKPVKMVDDRKLVQAGAGMKIDPKVGPRTAKEGSKDHFPDQNLGEIKSNGKFVGVVARDHEFVDGDRVKIYLNETIVDPNMLLTGAFKGVNIDLNKGFNRITFEALNEGSSSPNTAQVDVYDDQGQLIYSNKWLLSGGSRASLIVTKE